MVPARKLHYSCPRYVKLVQISSSYLITFKKIQATLGFTSSASIISGCQFGIQLYDWDGSTMIHSFDFQDNGIGVDGKLVTGGLVKGAISFQPLINFSYYIITIE